MTGDVAEVIVYDRYLSDSERAAIRTHLLTKYAWNGCYMANKSAGQQVAESASGSVRFALSGVVSIVDSDSFTLDDGSGKPVRVIAPGYLGIADGSHARAIGILDATTDPPSLKCAAWEVTSVP